MKETILNNLQYIGISVGIVLLTFIVSTLVNRFIKRLILKSQEEMDTDPTNYHFIRHIINAIIIIVGLSAAIYKLPGLKMLATSLLAGAGVLAVAVGFASQQALSNIISGVFIIIFKPFRINDRLKIGESMGVVEDIGLRHTVIRNFENKRIIIPNSIISNQVIVNSDYVDERICKWIEIGISYNSDITKAKEIIKDEIIKHPLNIDPRSEEQIEEGVELVPVKVISLDDSSILLRGWAWAKDSADAFTLNCDLMESIKFRLEDAGIEIPFPHRTLYIKNDENKSE